MDNISNSKDQIYYIEYYKSTNTNNKCHLSKINYYSYVKIIRIKMVL